MRKREYIIFAGFCLSYSLGLVAAVAADPPSMSDDIDSRFRQVWRSANLKPAELATDTEFVRRAYLDLTGCIPRISEVEQFLQRKDTDRRAQLIDELLRRPGHAKHVADVWIRALLPEDVNFADFITKEALRNWLAESFAANRPVDEVVSDLLLVRDQELPTYYYLAGPVTPEALAARTAESMLGLELECAECHDHPFASWTRDDFWGFAAFFANVQVRENAVMGVVLSRSIADDKRGELLRPGTKEVVLPRYLKGEIVRNSGERTRRQQLAAWLTSKENHYFARAAVNRIWAMLFGACLVESLDRMEQGKAEIHAELLTELADHFVDSGFDMRELVRSVAQSKLYQATSRISQGEPAPGELFHRRAAVSLTAEQLHESLTTALQQPHNAGPRLDRGMAIDLEKMAFVARMQASFDRVDGYGGEVHQALHLLNGKRIADATNWHSNPLLDSLLKSEFEDRQCVDRLFLAALARPPSKAAREHCVEQLRSASSDEQRGEVLSDILWALLNSAEFVLNH